jgi:NAD(P)-dependent dehydrogenase (short-subunit alcohol dehydrogenase family)
MAKTAGVVGLMRSWANYVGPHNIRVNGIALTAVRTPMAANLSISALFEVNPVLAMPARSTARGLTGLLEGTGRAKRLAGCDSAVDGQDGAGHVLRGVRGQEQGDGRHVLGLGYPSERHRFGEGR